MLLVAHRLPPSAAGCADVVRAGADLVELDVQLRGPAGAERVVVSHFLPLLRIRGWVEHDNAVFRWRSGRRPDLTLADALAMLPDGTGVLLDPKETDARRRVRLVDALAAALTDSPASHGSPAPPASSGPLDRFRVSTDDPGDLERYRAAGFTTWRTVKSPAQLRAVVTGRLVEPDVLSVRHTLLDERSVADLHGTVREIVAWTVNDPARAIALRELGVDGITTDRAEVMRAVG